MALWHCEERMFKKKTHMESWLTASPPQCHESWNIGIRLRMLRRLQRKLYDRVLFNVINLAVKPSSNHWTTPCMKSKKIWCFHKESKNKNFYSAWARSLSLKSFRYNMKPNISVRRSSAFSQRCIEKPTGASTSGLLIMKTPPSVTSTAVSFVGQFCWLTGAQTSGVR